MTTNDTTTTTTTTSAVDVAEIIDLDAWRSRTGRGHTDSPPPTPSGGAQPVPSRVLPMRERARPSALEKVASTLHDLDEQEARVGAAYLRLAAAICR